MAFEPLDKEDLIELWRRIFPASFTVPIEDEADGQGLDVFAQQAAQFERVGDAVNRSTQAYYLKPHSAQTEVEAMGPAPAAGSVEIARSPPLAGAIVLVAGTLLRAVQLDSQGDEVFGPLFALTADVTLPAGSIALVVAALEAVRPGYQGNLSARRITRFELLGRAAVTADVVDTNTLIDDGTPDRFTEGMLGQFVRFTTGLNVATFPRRILTAIEGATTKITVDGPALVFPDPGISVAVLEFEDLALTVTQPSPTTGGRHSFLDAIGFDRNAKRTADETDPIYRDRLCNLDDTISPAAILRIAARILTPKGIPFRLKETRDTLGGLRGFIWDFDPFDFGDISNGQVLLSEVSAVRYFALCVGPSDLGEFGFAFDGSLLPNPAAWDDGFFDGFPAEYLACLGALHEAIERGRAAGIAWDLIRDFSL